MRALTKTCLGLGGVTATVFLACTAGAQSSPPMSGASITGMADQYSRPHPGPAGTGASTWVKAAPPPAYVDTSTPPPRAPDAPPPAAVANRQPGQAAAPASDIVRPEASGAPELAAPAPAAARPALTPAALTAGRKLFGDNGCGGCHTLADAGAAGVVGPSFDGNAISADVAFQTIHDGRGPMPSFAGALTDPQIRQLANYIVGAKK